MLYVVCCMLNVVCCMLYVECCILYIVHVYCILYSWRCYLLNALSLVLIKKSNGPAFYVTKKVLALPCFLKQYVLNISCNVPKFCCFFLQSRRRHFPAKTCRSLRKTCCTACLANQCVVLQTDWVTVKL